MNHHRLLLPGVERQLTSVERRQKHEPVRFTNQMRSCLAFPDATPETNIAQWAALGTTSTSECSHIKALSCLT